MTPSGLITIIPLSREPPLFTPSPCISEIITRAVRAHGDREAIVVADQTLTYAELDQLSDRLVGYLVACGVGKSDGIALWLPNSVEYVIADLATLKLGAVLIPLSDMTTLKEATHCIRLAGARALICDGRFIDPVLSSLPSLRVRIRIGTDQGDEAFEAWASALSAQPIRRHATVSPDDPALVVFTGGTTGTPKGIDHRQGSLAICILSQILNGEIHAEDTLLLTTPLPHSAGYFLRAALYQGARVVLMRGFDADTVLRQAIAYEVTWTFAVPTMLYRLLRSLQSGAKAPPFRTIIYGAAPMDPARLAELQSIFGPVFIQLYGQSECPNFITRLTKQDHAVSDRLRSCGRPVPFAELEILRDSEPVPAGDVGEVSVHCAYVMNGYLPSPEQKAPTIEDGWLLTGDLGYLDEDGYLFLVDRAKDMIITGGLNVYSVEVETAIRRNPLIRDVAVLGLPDADWGEQVMAVVVAVDGFVPDTLRSELRTTLAAYKVPKQILLAGALPTTRYGKIDKKQLRASLLQTDEKVRV